MAKIGVLTLSDKGAAGQRIDESGPLVAELLAELGDVVLKELLPDDRAAIAAKLTGWCDEQSLDLIVTTGGTGLTPRDVTPQATLD
ncbi:MAG: molybdenum cofactor biosynthesis protein, partial [Gammaproteobacteria bacterium]|nr:molybdenum cofactor biosynthesis protein [Gammaproteobacteria bacterium]